MAAGPSPLIIERVCQFAKEPKSVENAVLRKVRDGEKNPPDAKPPQGEVDQAR